MEIFII